MSVYGASNFTAVEQGFFDSWEEPAIPAAIVAGEMTPEVSGILSLRRLKKSAMLSACALALVAGIGGSLWAVSGGSAPAAESDPAGAVANHVQVISALPTIRRAPRPPAKPRATIAKSKPRVRHHAAAKHVRWAAHIQ